MPMVIIPNSAASAKKSSPNTPRIAPPSQLLRRRAPNAALDRAMPRARKQTATMTRVVMTPSKVALRSLSAGLRPPARSLLRSRPRAHAAAGARPAHHSGPSPGSPTLALLAQLGNPLDEPAAQHLELGALHRGQVPRHLAVLILVDLEQPPADLLALVHHATHAVGVGGDAGPHLVVERLVHGELTLEQRLPLRAVPLLRRAQLRVLIVGQRQALAHDIVKALLDLLAQLRRLRRVLRLSRL